VAEEYMDDLNELGYGQSCLLIRQEYDTTINDLQYLHDDAPRKGSIGVVVTGKPGIGIVFLLIIDVLLTVSPRKDLLSILPTSLPIAQKDTSFS